MFSELFISSGSKSGVLRISKVCDTTPQSVSISKQIADAAHSSMEKSEVRSLGLGLELRFRV
jgi:hypothetical protein